MNVSSLPSCGSLSTASETRNSKAPVMIFRLERLGEQFLQCKLGHSLNLFERLSKYSFRSVRRKKLEAESVYQPPCTR